MKVLKYYTAALFLLAFSCLCQASGEGQEVISVWEDHSHGKKGVTLTPFLPDVGSGSRPAVIICPGGSYFWLSTSTEGEEVARELNRNGIAAFVLKYRVGGKFNFLTDMRFLYSGHSFPAMLDDAREAIRIVKGRAAEWGLGSVGIMGFSAGGHLAMLTEEYLSPDDPSSAPDFVTMIYPVVSMSDPSAHRRSRRGLLSFRASDRALREALSLEKNVPDNCCPVFLVNCEDDPVVDSRNSVLLDSALTARCVPHKYLKYPVGGHGFGIRPDWFSEFLSWLGETSNREN